MLPSLRVGFPIDYQVPYENSFYLDRDRVEHLVCMPHATAATLMPVRTPIMMLLRQSSTACNVSFLYGTVIVLT